MRFLALSFYVAGMAVLSLSLALCMFCVCSLGFFYVAIDCRFLSPHRRYALVLSASFPFDENMKSRSEEKESRGHAHLSLSTESKKK